MPPGAPLLPMGTDELSDSARDDKLLKSDTQLPSDDGQAQPVAGQRIPMQNLAPAEKEMWKVPTKQSPPQLTDEEINAKYAKRELRIVTESNREQLPNFVEALKRPGWMELRPFYQRRPRWEKVRQSKLIESFIMNVPVPPLFVYESDLAKYEVMDGQQRITAIQDFYTNKLTLEGL